MFSLFSSIFILSERLCGGADKFKLETSSVEATPLVLNSQYKKYLDWPEVPVLLRNIREITSERENGTLTNILPNPPDKLNV